MHASISENQQMCCELIRNAPMSEYGALSSGANSPCIGDARLARLASAVEGIRALGADVGFAVFDERAGKTLTLNVDTMFFGASTVKAMWVTYLFQEHLERGRIAWDEIAGHVEGCIAQSSNKAYTVLRSNYGSEQEFGDWLARVGVRPIVSWDYYTPREQALVWTHMMAYAESDGAYVDAWKATFNHSTRSFIREALGARRLVYSKPGWIHENERRPNTYDDAAIVIGADGKRRLMSIMSTMDPLADCALLRDLAAVLDALLV
ncbi:MAG TPA: hypothetical protein DCP91_13610 [Eggerthellaceae bacterium]|nr:hypothetical protein [Eggerthellaceae bacterium]